MASLKPKEYLYITVVFLVGILVMLPIGIYGIPMGNDLAQHYQFAQTYYDSLVNGDGFPSWSDKENFGYGGIGIRFYPPLAYYILAFARILTGSWYYGSWLTFTFWMVLGCLGVYYWARWWLSPKESAIAGVFYAIVPYHLMQLYISFLYADFAGASVLPFCFAFLTRVLGREKRSDILGLAVVYGILILTHLPSSIIGSLCISVYTLTLLHKKMRLRQIIKVCFGIFLGLAASSFYWLKMVSEMSWLNHASDKFSSGHYYFGNRFFPLYLHGIPSDYKDNFLHSDIILSFCFLFLASAIVYLFYKRTAHMEDCRVSHIFRSVLPLGLFGVFMITPLSYPVWKMIPFLPKIQFPLRWMAIVSMCGAVVSAGGVHFLIKGNFLKKRFWAYTSVIFPLLFLFLNLTYVWYPSAFVPIDYETFETSMQSLPEKQNYIFWWSIWSKTDALKINEKLLAENRDTTIDEWKPEEKVFTVAEGNSTKVRVALFYYPHWQADVNGKDVDIEQDDNGVILVPIPANKSVVTLRFQEPVIIKIVSIFSVAIWIAIIIGSFLLRVKSINSQSENLYFSEKAFKF